MINIHPKEIRGPWTKGFALDDQASPMTKVFFSGSRRFTRLNEAVRQRADNIIAKGFTLLIGDASGADALMQQYLAEKDYTKVIVYCTGGLCRNNAGHWQTRRVQPEAGEPSGFRYYVLKDNAMAGDATCGFVLWDGKSKGTLNNIINLLDRKKKVLVYFAPAEVFRQLNSRRDLASLLAGSGDQTLEKLERQLRIKMGRKAKERQLTFA